MSAVNVGANTVREWLRSYGEGISHSFPINPLLPRDIFERVATAKLIGFEVQAVSLRGNNSQALGEFAHNTRPMPGAGGGHWEVVRVNQHSVDWILLP